MESKNIFQEQLEQILWQSPVFRPIFNLAAQVELPNWYVAGGCVTQTIWNWQMGLEPLHGLKDVDLVYFKNAQSESDEHSERQRIKKLFKDLPIPIDVINEARVHEWYLTKFGYEIPAYSSTEDGINTWLPAFSIGIRPEASGIKLFAPFGLTDAFEMIVRPNKRQITEEIFNKMVLHLRKDWPDIQVISWS
ncbi:MAG: nucleotidyltransferase family protein [Bdellovibrionales bacterium]|nr:nucleotidyltransferase family protein [Bdellovibrionales bacterium]